jgi:hypothetical protein
MFEYELLTPPCRKTSGGFLLFMKLRKSSNCVRFANFELNAAKESCEIVKSRGEAAPNSRGLPRPDVHRDEMRSD